MLQSGRFKSEVESLALFECVLEKLPQEIKSQWGIKNVSVYPRALNLKDFDEWLHQVVKAEMVVSYSLSSDLFDRSKAKKPLAASGNAKKAVFTTFN